MCTRTLSSRTSWGKIQIHKSDWAHRLLLQIAISGLAIHEDGHFSNVVLSYVVDDVHEHMMLPWRPHYSLPRGSQHQHHHQQGGLGRHSVSHVFNLGMSKTTLKPNHRVMSTNTVTQSSRRQISLTCHYVIGSKELNYRR